MTAKTFGLGENVKSVEIEADELGEQNELDAKSV